MKKEFVLSIEKKTFVNEQGKECSYFALSTTINEQWFRLQVDKDDKKLFNFIVRDFVK